MIVCVCNNLNEQAIDSAIGGGAHRPCAIFKACGSRAECGICVPHILKRIPDVVKAGKPDHCSPCATKSAKPEPV